MIMVKNQKHSHGVLARTGLLLLSVILTTGIARAESQPSNQGIVPQLELVQGATTTPPCNVKVRVLVDPRGATADVSQFAVRYKSSCMTFAQATLGAEAPGGSTLDWNVPPATTVFPICGSPACASCDTDFDSHVVVLVTPPSGSTYGGTGDKEIAVLHFTATTPGTSCAIEWDQSVPPGLLPTYVHLSTGDVYGAGIDFVPNAAPPSCPGLAVAVPQQNVSGTARYYFPLPQPNTNWLPDLEACISPPGSPTACGTSNSTGNYSLSGFTPGSRTLQATRTTQAADPFALGGGDVNLLVKYLGAMATLTPNQEMAADVDLSGGVPNAADAQKLRRYLVFDPATCPGCATWKILCDLQSIDTPAPCPITISSCVNDTVNMKGILRGDVDGSWPGRLKAQQPSPIAVDFAPPTWNGMEFVLPVVAEIGEGSLASVRFTVEFDPDVFEYLGAATGERTERFDLTLNPDRPQILHGLLTGGTEVTTSSGTILELRLRLRQPAGQGRIRFTRLLVDDRETARVPEIDVARDRVVEALPRIAEIQAAPNPFNPLTRIEYAVPQGRASMAVTIQVLDLSGRLVREILQGEQRPGRYQASWDGTTSHGESAASGVYLLRLQAGSLQSIDKVVLLK